MNTIVEKLAAIEREMATIQPKMEPLSGRIADLHEKVTGFTQQLADLAAESMTVKHDVELTRQSLAKIQTLIGESKTESEQLAAGQEENQQRCETMTAVFGAAFQAVSQFFETAQRMGIADQAKAVFTIPPIIPPTALPQPEAHIPQVVPSENSEIVPQNDEATPEESAPSPPVTQEFQAEQPESEQKAAEQTAEPISPDSDFTDSDFDDALSGGLSSELDSVPMPVLPDVAAAPDMLHSEVETDSLSEPAEEIASQMDVPPLNLSVPELPAQSDHEAESADDQDIEAMLASMMSPVTVGAGN